MLETFREHSKGWLAKLILAFITIPFALWGIDSYLHQAGSSVAVAKVNGQTVTVQEYSNALQNLRTQLQAEGKTDPALLDDPVVKQSVLDKLITSRLLASEVRHANLVLTDDQLGKAIIELPEFQQNGKFSQELYDEILKQNHLTPSQFEGRMRNELLIQQLRDGIAATAYLPESLTAQFLRIERQQREVSVAEVKAADYLPQVKVDAAEIQAYYQKNKDKFRIPEQVKLEYAVFSANALIPTLQISDDEVKKYYDENASKFQGDEQRRASHILIAFGKADAAAKKAAHDKAESVLAEVKKSPDRFAELAKKYSQDPGSAEKGGDLGLFGRGMMVKPFEDAVFTMAPGSMSGLVESDFGYHIIKLTEIQGHASGFDDVKLQIRAELLSQKAQAKFAEQADGFNNMVYEQSDSLQPVVKAYGASLQTSPWMSRNEVDKLFKDDKLTSAIFSSEALKEKRNTAAFEVQPNTLIAARVLEYKPSAPRTYEEVSPAIGDLLKQQKALEMAVKRGAEDLAALREGKEVAGLDWIPPVVIDRKNAQGLSDPIMQHAFKISAAKLPAYGGIEGKTSYSLIRVSRVDAELPSDDSEKKLAEGAVQAALASEYVASYLNSLRKKADVTRNKPLLANGNLQQ